MGNFRKVREATSQNQMYGTLSVALSAGANHLESAVISADTLRPLFVSQSLMLITHVGSPKPTRVLLKSVFTEFQQEKFVISAGSAWH